MILAIDPGKDKFALAWFDQVTARFFSCDYVTADQLPRVAAQYAVSTLFLERQYLTKKHPRPMDIVELAFGAGLAKGLVVQAWGADVVEYQPMVWKGNVPKEIMRPRILSKLDTQEVARIPKTLYKNHNVIDAIGIGLYGLRRLK